MRFLKKLVLNLIKDDIESILKAHDESILVHYLKIVEDVETILEKRNADIEERSRKIFEEAVEEKLGDKIGELDDKFMDFQRRTCDEFKEDIANTMPTVGQLKDEFDYDELVTDIKERILYTLNYRLLASEVISKIAKSCE